jgi:glucose/arabinose dehydrogenase
MALTLETVADGFVHPLAVAEPPDGSGRLFVLDQVGKIWVIDADGRRRSQPFLDISDRLVELDESYDERGLLGFTFAPDFVTSGRLYVFYTAPLRMQAPENFDHTNVLAEYQVSLADGNVVDPESERRILQIDHPYSNHNAGSLAFGSDGMLYVSLGDGGYRNDVDQEGVTGHAADWYETNAGGNGQDIEHNLLGSIIRIDVRDEQVPYVVPDDNPFVGVPGVLPEIWAYGFRNPVRFSIDPRGTHAMIVGDVGQEMYEEISLVKRGGNYGWNVYEGNHCFDASAPTHPLDSCPTQVGAGSPDVGADLIPPVIELQTSTTFGEYGMGTAIVGGVVNRGGAMPSSEYGRYFFGVWSTAEVETAAGETYMPGKLLVATIRPGGPWSWESVELLGSPNGDLDGYLLGFGQDSDGDVYVLTSEDVGPTGTSGKVRRLVESPRE